MSRGIGTHDGKRARRRREHKLAAAKGSRLQEAYKTVRAELDRGERGHIPWMRVRSVIKQLGLSKPELQQAGISGLLTQRGGSEIQRILGV